MGDRDWHDLNEGKVSDRTSIMRNEGDGGICCHANCDRLYCRDG